MRDTVAPRKAVCSFFGHYDIYDTDLKQRLTRALFTLAQQHDAVEFLFHRQGRFSHLCFLSALMTKQHFPGKAITLTLVQSEKDRDHLFAHPDLDVHALLYSLADEVLIPPIRDTDHPLADRKRISRWVLQQSTHLVRYLYRELDELPPKDYQAIQHSGATLLDVSSAETAAFLSEQVRLLPAQEQALLTGWISGAQKKQLGTQLGLTPALAGRCLSRAVIALLKSLQSRYAKQRRESAPHVCGIVSMGTVSYKTLCLFEQAVLLLSRDCSVSKFLVASEYGDSEYIYLLNQLPKHAEITVVTPSPVWTGPSPFPFPLPYQNVEALESPAAADPLSFPKALLSRSDYCICNLPPNLRHIKSHLTEAAGVTVLDLGQASPAARGNR